MSKRLKISRYLQTHIPQKKDQRVKNLRQRNDNQNSRYHCVAEKIPPCDDPRCILAAAQRPVKGPAHMYAARYGKGHAEPEADCVIPLLLHKKHTRQLADQSKEQHAQLHLQKGPVHPFQSVCHLNHRRLLRRPPQGQPFLHPPRLLLLPSPARTPGTCFLQCGRYSGRRQRLPL